MADALTRSDLDEALSPLRDRLDTIDGRLDAVDRRFEAVDRRFEAVDRRFDEVDRQFSILNKRIGTEISRALGVIEERFSSLFVLLDEKFGARVDGLRRDLDAHIADRTAHAGAHEGK